MNSRTWLLCSFGTEIFAESIVHCMKSAGDCHIKKSDYSFKNLDHCHTQRRGNPWAWCQAAIAGAGIKERWKPGALAGDGLDARIYIRVYLSSRGNEEHCGRLGHGQLCRQFGE